MSWDRIARAFSGKKKSAAIPVTKTTQKCIHIIESIHSVYTITYTCHQVIYINMIHYLRIRNS